MDHYGRATIVDDRRGGFPTRQDSGWDHASPTTQEGFTGTQDDRRNGIVAVEYKGTPFVEVPLLAQVPSSSGWNFTSFLPSVRSILNLTNTKAPMEGGSSVGGSRGGSERPPPYYIGNGSEYSGRLFHKPPEVFESIGANGSYSREVGDFQRVSILARKEASANDLEVSLREIERLENRYKTLEKEFSEALKRFHVERIRADDYEKENRIFQRMLEGLSLEKVALEKKNGEYQGKLEGLYLHKVALERKNREDQRKLEGLYLEKVALEKKNGEYQEKLEGLSLEKVAFEKKNKEYQGQLEGLSLEKMRADKLERENREYLAKLKKKEQEVGELQSKFQGQASTSAALEANATELKKLQNSLQDIRLENQELKSWKTEQERKILQDISTTGQFRTKVADLTYAKGQLENKEQQLTNRAQEQTKRIEDLKQKNSVLVVKMGALESQMQSLLDRLREERGKSSKLQQNNTELQQKNTEIEGLMQQSFKVTAPADKDNDQKAQERALEAQCSTLEGQVESKELETQSLKTQLREEWENTSKLKERLRQCDLEIDDLKHLIQDLEKSDSQSVEFLAPPKEYIRGESFLETDATPYLLDGAVQRVHQVAGIFARLLMKAMEQGKIDGMAVARNNFVRSISLGKAAPLKYVLEAITCKLLFQGFEHECFDMQDSTSGFLDMEQQRMDNFCQYKYLNSIDDPEQLVLTEDSIFTHFCRIKLENLSAAIPEIESMVQEIISRTFERSFSSKDTSTDIATYLASKLGTTFVKLAVCVWQVHKLAFAFNPVARIFRVSQSEKFVEKYMESVIFHESESEDEDMPRIDISRVDFMVVPGFLINRIVIRSRVFVVTKPLSSTFQILQQSGEIQLAPM